MDTLSPLSLLLLSIHNDRKLPTPEWVGAFWVALGYKMNVSNCWEYL